jgi:lysophospholipase L1-like esterase
VAGSLRKSAALAVGSALVALLAIEAGLRVGGYTPRKFHATARIIDAHWRLLLDCYPTNPRGYFDIDLREARSRDRYQHLAPLRYESLARRTPFAVESRYNSLRFRDAEFGPRRPGVRRVMVLGDSFTEGQGVKEPDTCVRVLESRLNAGGQERWEALNCGRRGADFPLLFEMFEQVLRYEPDVVVYAMVLNDAAQSQEFHARQSYVNDLILDRGRAATAGHAAPDIGHLDSRLLGFVRDRLETRRTSRETTRWYLDMYGEANREGWTRTQGYLREMNKRMRERGGRLLVASWPLLVNLEGEDPFAAATETVSRFCVTAGIPWHDLRPALRARPTSSLWVHPVDMHPNELAQRLAAESLAPAVRELGPASP